MALTREQPEASNLVIGTLHILGRPARVLVDPGASLCFASEEFYESLVHHIPERQCDMMVDLPSGDYMRSFDYLEGITVEVQGHQLPTKLYPLQLRDFDVILGMNWLEAHSTVVDCQRKTVRVKCVDTAPGSVDTSPRFQKTCLPDWDSVSTQSSIPRKTRAKSFLGEGKKSRKEASASRGAEQRRQGKKKEKKKEKKRRSS
ncbi:hypothetical protein Taro_039736 [Colocasia esculenta]|uniref:Uncharacterized protein n=1 Tax=Colocasia esculenta TaxID=4460 RepID=A0A843WR06_COLES|nr:hypothetical protein [Colocasia esculenta]